MSELQPTTPGFKPVLSELIMATLFPHIVSVRKLFFLEFGNFIFLPNNLNFCCGNYLREKTIQGRTPYEEIRYGTYYFYYPYLQVMKGYFDNESATLATQKDGWLYSGQ